MKAIILAAGKGTRIQDYTTGEPKSLIKIHDFSILEHTLRALLELNIKDIDIVVGHKKEKIITSVKEMRLPGKISSVFNDKYSTTGTAYSLLKGLEECGKDDVIILEADVIFEKGLLQSLIKSSFQSNVTLLEQFYPGLDGSFVELDDEGFITDWTHKNMRSEDAPIEHLFKTINIHKFTSEFIHTLLIPQLEALYNLISSGNESLERIFRDIIHRHPGCIQGLNNNRLFAWQEVDDIEDLHSAREQFKVPSLCSLPL